MILRWLPVALWIWAYVPNPATAGEVCDIFLQANKVVTREDFTWLQSVPQGADYSVITDRLGFPFCRMSPGRYAYPAGWDSSLWIVILASHTRRGDSYAGFQLLSGMERI